MSWQRLLWGSPNVHPAICACRLPVRPRPCQPCVAASAMTSGIGMRLHSPYTGVPSPLGPKPPKSLKKVFAGLPAQSIQKVSTKSPNTFFDSFSGSLGLFDTFLILRAGRPAKTFWRLFGDFGPRGLRTPVYGDCNRKHRNETQRLATKTLFEGVSVEICTSSLCVFLPRPFVTKTPFGKFP